MSEAPTVRKMLESIGGIEELYEVRTFMGYRNGSRVTVRLLDLGPDCDNPTIRFVCKVEQEDGKKAQGNNAPTAHEAIAIVHWGELD